MQGACRRMRPHVPVCGSCRRVKALPTRTHTQQPLALKTRVPQPIPLPQVNMDVEARFVQDMLRGDEAYEIRLKLKEHHAEEFPFKDDD